jgi:hypothetical protein
MKSLRNLQKGLDFRFLRAKVLRKMGETKGFLSQIKEEKKKKKKEDSISGNKTKI